MFQLTYPDLKQILMNTYRVKIIKAGLEIEVEGDKKFVIEMVDRFEKGGEQRKATSAKGSELTVNEISTNKSLSAGEFIRKIGFKKDVDIVLAFGYYLENHGGQSSFAPTDINTCYYEAKMESSNTSQSIIYLIRKGFLMEAKQPGKKGKKKYTLTTSGIDFIELKLKENAKGK